MFFSYGYKYFKLNLVHILHCNTFDYMKEKKDAFSLRLGSLRTPLEEEAKKHERSLAWWIKKILRDYINKKS